MYQKRIAALLNPADAIDPRHVEAHMRVGFSTLDHLDSRTFAREVCIARDCARANPALSERLAQSYGL